MCGISGCISENLNEVVKKWVEESSERLRHRGPDAKGIFIDDTTIFAHRRLSIIGLSESSNQPMQINDRYVISYNGEIYNYKEIKKELELLGESFKTESDTEVILFSFQKWGLECVKKFIGMFAFCIYDKHERKYYFCRDRVGVKPLFYMKKNRALYFSSEIKVFNNKIFDFSIDKEGLYQYYKFGYIPNPRTILKDIKQVEPGCWMIYDHGNDVIQKIRYWDIYEIINEKGMIDAEEDDILDELESLLVSSFKYRLVSDVPVGVFLSGGIDSSLLVTLLANQGISLKTFTIGFKEKHYDESDRAKYLSEVMGTDHTRMVFSDSDIEANLLDYFDIYDQPFGDTSGFPTYLVSKLARSDVKVCLSADGGDELFGGYRQYLVMQKVDKYRQIIPSILINSINKSRFMLNKMNNRIPNFPDRIKKVYKYWQSCDYSDLVSYYHDDELKKLLDLVVTDTGGDACNSLDHACLLDFERYLPDNIMVKVDRASMYVSLEAREPMLDHRLIEFAFRLPEKYKVHNGESKYALKKILERYLPKEYIYSPKKGFSIPIEKYLYSKYKYLVYDALDSLGHDHFYNEKYLGYIKRRYERKEINIGKIWLLISYDYWKEHWL